MHVLSCKYCNSEKKSFLINQSADIVWSFGEWMRNTEESAVFPLQFCWCSVRGSYIRMRTDQRRGRKCPSFDASVTVSVWLNASLIGHPEVYSPVRNPNVTETSPKRHLFFIPRFKLELITARYWHIWYRGSTCNISHMRCFWYWQTLSLSLLSSDQDRLSSWRLPTWLWENCLATQQRRNRYTVSNKKAIKP